jgi:hypothetical protein
MGLKKFRELIDAVNSYYGFALIVYAAVLYVASHSHLFFWVFIIVTPLLTGWTGYLLKSFLNRRNQRQGFNILSEAMTYEVGNNHKYTLRYSIRIKAGADHLMVYPIGYQWTGSGQEAIPKIVGSGQQLLGVTKQPSDKNDTAEIVPYVLTGSGEEDWHYWFVALNPPVYKGEVVEIKYSQDFYDEKGTAKPYLYYIVRVPLKRLELNVKFSSHALPKIVTGSYTRPSDARHSHATTDMHYDSEKQWATWVVEQPKNWFEYSKAK